MKRFNKHLIIISFLLLVTAIVLPQNASAQVSTRYDNYDVEIEINKDSTFTVKETIGAIFNGNLNGIRRDVTLFNSANFERCEQNPDETCGGFDILFDAGAGLINGRSNYQYEAYEFSPEESSDRFFRFEQRLKREGGEFVTNERYTWEVNYEIYGGIKELDTEFGRNNPVFYWNLFPENRGGLTESATATIILPEGVVADVDRFELIDISRFTYDVVANGNRLEIDLGTLPSFSYITASYVFDNGEVDSPVNLDLDIKQPVSGLNISLDDKDLPSAFGNNFQNFPTGERTFKFERFGYESETEIVNFSGPGNESLEVDLQPNGLFLLLQILTYIQLIVGIMLIPLAIFIAVRIYQTKGRDIGKPKTIVPIFKPPSGLKSYLLGSLKDEKVDTKDITSTLIDLAYRGKIKIVEKGKKNFDLLKVDNFDDSQLNQFEKELIDAIFGTLNKRNIKNLPSTFPGKLKNLTNDVYDEMVNLGYFKSSPRRTRNVYFGIGITFLIIGVISSIFMTILLVTFVGIYTLFTLGLAISFFGLVVIMNARYMPAKTSVGSKVYGETLGFKMFLETAEKYRLQNLKPEDFEKYLSYAIVFGVEKKWAKSFEGIYEGQPDWYTGNSDAFSTIYLANALNNFSTSSAQSIAKSVASSSSGSGWSGGGSFGGGFSGGGGGGGSVGGW